METVDRLTPECLQIPRLDLEMQLLDLDTGKHSIRRWGTEIKARYNGVYLVHFYAAERKFRLARTSPERFVHYGIKHFVEPNFKTTIDTPVWLAIDSIARKRRAAMIWHANKHKTMVDLNVHDRFIEMMLWGVPEGWRSYAIKASAAAGSLKWFDERVRRARERAGTSEIVLLVVGGGRQFRDWAGDNGYLWVPEPRVGSDEPCQA